MTEGGEVGDNLLRLNQRVECGDECGTAGCYKSRSKDRPLQGME